MKDSRVIAGGWLPTWVLLLKVFPAAARSASVHRSTGPTLALPSPLHFLGAASHSLFFPDSPPIATGPPLLDRSHIPIPYPGSVSNEDALRRRSPVTPVRARIQLRLLRRGRQRSLIRLRGGEAADGVSTQRLVELRDLLRNDRRVVQAMLDAEASQPAGRRSLTRQLQQLCERLREALLSADEDGVTSLHRAVIEQDARRVRALLRAGVDVNVAAGDVRVRPLHLATLAGDARPECLEALLAYGADVDAADKHGVTALHAAAALNMPHIAALLLDAGAHVDVAGNFGVKPLQFAAWSNAAEAVQVLLDAGAAVDDADEEMRTACHSAAVRDAAEALEVLLDGGGRVDCVDSRGWTPLFHACRACSCTDARCGRTRALVLLLQRGASAAAADHKRWTALHVAASCDRIAAVRLLLHAGADTCARGGPVGVTPLMLAAFKGATQSIAELLAAGARVDDACDHGVTALQAAAAGGHGGAARLLLRHGACVEARDESGKTAAHIAAHYDAGDVIAALGEGKADLTAATPSGWTPLHEAANASSAEAAAALLEHGALAVAQDNEHGWTPLHVATHRYAARARACQCDVCRRETSRRACCLSTLLRSGAVPTDVADRNGATAAHIAAMHDSDAALRLLRAARANLWRTDKRGLTPLHIAGANHRPSRAVCLLLMLRPPAQRIARTQDALDML